MLRCFLSVVLVLASALASALADDALYRYEGDVHPLDPGAGWVIGNPCESPCNESLEDGHFVLRWPYVGDLVYYDYTIANPGEAPPLRCGSSGGFVPTIR